MTYTLNVRETGNKSAKYHYTVTDEDGNIISERKSNRVYVACTIYGAYYFGRKDLVGRGDHGRALKSEWAYKEDGGNWLTVAYLKENQ